MPVDFEVRPRPLLDRVISRAARHGRLAVSSDYVAEAFSVHAWERVKKIPDHARWKPVVSAWSEYRHQDGFPDGERYTVRCGDEEIIRGVLRPEHQSTLDAFLVPKHHRMVYREDEEDSFDVKVADIVRQIREIYLPDWRYSDETAADPRYVFLPRIGKVDYDGPELDRRIQEILSALYGAKAVKNGHIPTRAAVRIEVWAAHSSFGPPVRDAMA